MIYKRQSIKTLLQRFHKDFPYLEWEQVLEYFAIFGGLEIPLEIEYFDDFFRVIEKHFVEDFEKYQQHISPSYLLENPYRGLLIAIASGDAKYYRALRKAKLSEALGERLIEELIASKIVFIEYSREAPLRVHPKHKLKKEYRSYRIQDKIRFTQPFMRFWFGFVAPYERDLLGAKKERFMQNFRQHYERLRSLVFEQLSNALLIEYFKEKNIRLVSHGSYWNIYSEFDILALSQDKKIILGECKYKERVVCKNELTKLQQKAHASNIKVDIYALFSKQGFSKELLGMLNQKLLLFDLKDLQKLL